MARWYAYHHTIILVGIYALVAPVFCGALCKLQNLVCLDIDNLSGREYDTDTTSVLVSKYNKQ
jgi:hypothetical protein